MTELFLVTYSKGHSEKQQLERKGAFVYFLDWILGGLTWSTRPDFKFNLPILRKIQFN